MPPTSKKLTGHIGFGLCVRLSVHQEPCMLGFWNFIYGFLMEKYLTHIFFLVWVLSLSGVMPFWIKSEWNLMHAISYELCMQGFWNFMYGFLMEKYLTLIFFLVRVDSLIGVMPLWKNQNEILSARYLEKYLNYGLETWSADRGWWVDYPIKFSKKFFYFSGIMALWKFGHFKFVSKISQKLYELGAWNMVSW